MAAVPLPHATQACGFGQSHKQGWALCAWLGPGSACLIARTPRSGVRWVLGETGLGPMGRVRTGELSLWWEVCPLGTLGARVAGVEPSCLAACGVDGAWGGHGRPGPKVGSVLTPGDLGQGLTPRRQPGSLTAAGRLSPEGSCEEGLSTGGCVWRGPVREALSGEDATRSHRPTMLSGRAGGHWAPRWRRTGVGASHSFAGGVQTSSRPLSPSVRWAVRGHGP